MPLLPINICEQEGRITDTVATCYQGLLAKVQEEMEYLIDVQRSILRAHIEYLYDLQENLFAFCIGLRIFLP